MPIVVIGGGFAGLAISLVLAQAGKSVVLLERHAEVGRGASAASLRVIHGGFRYVASGKFSAALNSTEARAAFHRLFPQFVHPLLCGVTISRPQALGASLCARIYSRLARRSGFGAHAAVRRASELNYYLPEFLPYCGSRVLLWEDSLLVDPAAFARTLFEQCREAGVQFCCGLLARRVVVHADGAEVYSVPAVDPEASSTVIQARYVIHAPGYQLHDLHVEGDGVASRMLPSCARAWNVVVDAPIIEDEGHAFAVPLPSGRLAFLTKRGNGTAVGTMYDPLPPHQALEPPSLAAQLAFLREVSVGLRGEWRFSPASIVGVDVGGLPVRRWRKTGPVFLGSDTLRRYGAFIEVITTKFTTCLLLGDQVLAAMQ